MLCRFLVSYRVLDEGKPLFATLPSFPRSDVLLQVSKIVNTKMEAPTSGATQHQEGEKPSSIPQTPHHLIFVVHGMVNLYGRSLFVSRTRLLILTASREINGRAWGNLIKICLSYERPVQKWLQRTLMSLGRSNGYRSNGILCCISWKRLMRKTFQMRSEYIMSKSLM